MKTKTIPKRFHTEHEIVPDNAYCGPGQGYRPTLVDCTFWNNLFENLPIFLLTQIRDVLLSGTSFSCNHFMQAEPGLAVHPPSGTFFEQDCLLRFPRANWAALEDSAQCRALGIRVPDLACLTKLHFDCVQPLYTWLSAIIWHYYFLLQLKRHFVRIHAPLVIWILSRCALIFKIGIRTEIFCITEMFASELCYVLLWLTYFVFSTFYGWWFCAMRDRSSDLGSYLISGKCGLGSVLKNCSHKVLYFCVVKFQFAFDEQKENIYFM